MEQGESSQHHSFGKHLKTLPIILLVVGFAFLSSDVATIHARAQSERIIAVTAKRVGASKGNWSLEVNPLFVSYHRRSSMDAPSHKVAAITPELYQRWVKELRQTRLFREPLLQVPRPKSKTLLISFQLHVQNGKQITRKLPRQVWTQRDSYKALKRWYHKVYHYAASLKELAEHTSPARIKQALQSKRPTIKEAAYNTRKKSILSLTSSLFLPTQPAQQQETNKRSHSLSHIRNAIQEQLMQASRSPIPANRVVAIDQLGQHLQELRSLTQTYRKQLLKGLQDKNKWVQLKAATYTKQWAPPQAKSTLAKLLKTQENDLLLYLQAAKQMFSLSPTQAAHAFLKILKMKLKTHKQLRVTYQVLMDRSWQPNAPQQALQRAYIHICRYHLQTHPLRRHRMMRRLVGQAKRRLRRMYSKQQKPFHQKLCKPTFSKK